MKAFFVLRLWGLLFLPVITFLAIAHFTEDRALILILNIVQVAVAVAVAVAFTPEVVNILLSRVPMNRGSWIAYGIWMSWGAVIYRTIESLTWRFMGQPAWLINSDWTSVYLWAGIIGATCHIIRPGELSERVPTKELIRLGIILGTAVAIGLGILYGPEISAAWQGRAASFGPIRESAVAGPPPSTAEVRKDVMPDVWSEAYGRGNADFSARIEARVSQTARERLDDWMASNHVFNRSEAVRRILDEGLDAEDKAAAGPYQPERR